MEIPPTTLSTPEQESTLTSSEEHHHHHRKNHRGGAKERAKKERKALGPLTPSTPSSVTSSSATGAKKHHHHRAGVKYRAKRERQASHTMTSEGLDSTYDSDENIEDKEGDEEDQDQHSERDTPSLTYDSDNHSEDHEDIHFEDGDPVDLFRPEDVQPSLVPEAEIQSNGEALTYHEKGESGVAEGKVLLKTREEAYEEKTLVSPRAAVLEQTKSQTPSVTSAPPKEQVKQPIKLLSLMRPKVL